MPQSRQLAAIMFTDIVGFTALMGEDEQRALSLLKTNRKVQQPIIEKFNGRWLKEIGDGVLASFPTVTDAVHCAGAIQKTSQGHPDLKLRIGIHEGEVVFDETDVFGDGVNIASRLEPLAPVGGILVSESVHRNLVNKPNITSTFLREEQLKNVKEPIKIYSVQVEDLVTSFIATTPAIAKESKPASKPRKYAFAVASALLVIFLSYFIYSNFNQGENQVEHLTPALDKSIVVLPFTDLSPDQDQEYFSDGMMEEILNHLSKVNDLKVISRTTAMQYRATNKPISVIAKELGVATALEGSVRKDGDNLRITLQLIEGATDTHLWSESYDREMTNIFQIQSDVAQRVAEVLQADITPETKISIEAQPTSSTEAYNLYLLGRHFWYQRTKEGLEKSIDYFEQSIAKDPNYALAYSGMADAYFIMVSYNHIDREIGFPKAKQYALRAQEIDPNLAQVQATLGTIAKREWDWQEAETRLKRAIELDPDYLMARHWYAEYLFVMGPPEELLVQINEGLRIDPFSILMRSQLADYYYDKGELEVALEEYKRLLELDPMEVRGSHRAMFEIYLELGNHDDAFKALKIYHEKRNYGWGQSYDSAYHQQGMEAFFNKWLESSLKDPNFPPHIADLYVLLGDHQNAFDWLDKSYEVKIIYLPDKLMGRFYRSLRTEPRFKELAEKLGIQNSEYLMD